MIKKIAVSFLFAFVFLLLANQALGAENYCTPFSGGIYTDEHPEGSWNHCEGNELIKYSCVGDDWKTNPPVNCEQIFGYCVGNKCVFDSCQTSSDCGIGKYCATKLTPKTCENGCTGTVPSNANACPKPSNFEFLVGINGKFPIKISKDNSCPNAPCYYRCDYPTYAYDPDLKKCSLNAPNVEAGKCDANDRIPITIWKDGTRFKLIPIMDGEELNPITVGKSYIYQGKPGKSYSFKAYEIDADGNKIGVTGYSCKNCPAVCAPDYDGGDGNTRPTATITVPAGNQTVRANTSINFTGTGSDSDAGDAITGYEWRMGSCNSGTLLSSGSVVPNTQTIEFPVTKTIYFKVKDKNNAWSACDSRTVTITSAGDPTLDFYPENNIYTIPSGTGTTLHWTTTNASTCTATGDWTGLKGINGSEPTGVINASKTYILECFKGSSGFNNSGSSVSVKKSLTISVNSCVPLCNDTTVCQGIPYVDSLCHTTCLGTKICGSTCTPKCTPSNLANICSGEIVNDGCTAGLTCTGTKDCSWREVAP